MINWILAILIVAFVGTLLGFLGFLAVSAPIALAWFAVPVVLAVAVMIVKKRLDGD